MKVVIRKDDRLSLRGVMSLAAAVASANAQRAASIAETRLGRSASRAR